MTAARIVTNRHVVYQDEIENYIASRRVFRPQNKPVDRATIAIGDAHLGVCRLDSIGGHKQFHRPVGAGSPGPFDPDVVSRIDCE